MKHLSKASGTIDRIENCGTIVMVILRTAQGFLTPVFFDHSPFRWMLEAEDCGVNDLIGRQASFDGQTMTFPE